MNEIPSDPLPASSRKPRLKKLLALAAGAFVAIGAGLQLVPVKGVGDNPTERYKVEAPPEVEAILRRACFDCHTNETKWPWYSRIAPGSWLMVRDVLKGRARFNMSEWGDLEESDRALDKENAAELVEKGEMPPWFYIVPLHPEAKLSDAEKATLRGWLLAGLKK